MEATLPIDLGDENFVAATLHFAKTWTYILAVQPGEAIAIDEPASGFELHRRVRATAGLLPRRFELRVTYDGEAPRLQRVKGERAAAATPADTTTGAKQLIPQPKAAPASSLEQEFRTRAKIVAASNDPAQVFFFELDRATYFPLLAEQPQTKPLAESIASYAGFLRVRTLRRATYVKYGLRYPGSPQDAQFEKNARAIEPVLRAAFAKVESNGTIDTDLLGDHVYRFVNGELALSIASTQNRHGGPNSANFFCFTEVLLHFRAMQLHWDYWQHALRPFVVGTMAFVQLYWNRVSRRSTSYDPSFVADNHAGDWQQWKQLEAALLERAPADPTAHLIDAFGDTVAYALRDDVALSPIKNLFLAP